MKKFLLTAIAVCLAATCACAAGCKNGKAFTGSKMHKSEILPTETSENIDPVPKISQIYPQFGSDGEYPKPIYDDNKPRPTVVSVCFYCS